MARSRGTFAPVHSSPFARLAANVREEGDCWVGTEVVYGRGGYLQVNFRVPGLGGRIVKFSAHVLAWVAWQIGTDASIDDLYLAYLEFRCSGLVLDHTCENPPCRCPAHLDPCTQSENVLRRYRGRATPTAPLAAPIVEDTEPLPF